MTFQSLGLSQPVLKALEQKNYGAPTPIQSQAIPTLLGGRDLLGIAQTGTGKTAAFMLPSIDRLVAANRPPMPGSCRMLVLAPTRELASQIADSARAYARFARLSVACVFGGTPIGRNRRAMQPGVDILVATPGRLMDLIDQRIARLDGLEIFVLDEADQMLDLGFIHTLKRIVRLLPKKRQSLFFSATMPKSIRELADAFLTDPAEVSVKPAASTAERVSQQVTFVNQAEKQALLTIQLRDPAIDRALVFTRTKHGADRVVRLLAGNGIQSNAIHGNKSQPQREKALAAFRSGQVPILVATDIAARGIDVSGVSHVFNFELPNVPEQYVHRIGRTARAGAEGIAVSFCADDERSYMRDIEKLIRQKVEVVPLPAGFMIEAEKVKTSRVAVRPERDEMPRHRGHGDRGGRGEYRGYGDRNEGARRPDRGQRRPDQRAGSPRDAHMPRRDGAGFDPLGAARPERNEEGRTPARHPRPAQRYHAQPAGARREGPHGEQRPRREGPVDHRGPRREGGPRRDGGNAQGAPRHQGNRPQRRPEAR